MYTGCVVKKMFDPLLAVDIGIALECSSTFSDGFCVVKDITCGGPVESLTYQTVNDPMEKYFG